MKANTTRPIIKCPHCGYEYLAGEIFFPNNFLGQPKKLVRDALGKIIYEEYRKGQEWDNSESFVCEGCNKSFVVEAVTTFKTKDEDEELDFSTQEVSLI